MNETSWTELLENNPPYVFYSINKPFAENGQSSCLDIKNIKSYCDHEDCRRERNYNLINPEIVSEEKLVYSILKFECDSCRIRRKTIGIWYDQRKYNPENENIRVMKLFELPPFYSPVSESIRNVLGARADLYLKARQCESMDLGAAAFVYYKKVLMKIYDKLKGNAELEKKLRLAFDGIQDIDVERTPEVKLMKKAAELNLKVIEIFDLPD